LLAAGWSAGESGTYPPFLGMWMPNVVLGGAGIYLLIRTAKEKPLKSPEYLLDFVSILKRRFLRDV